MCRMAYAASWDRVAQAQCCPSSIAATAASVKWRPDKPASTYASLVDFWSRWNRAYADAKDPRLMVRYEDLLWRPEETTAAVCACVGGTMAPTFDPIAGAAKGGVAHGSGEATGRASAMAKYGAEAHRYAHLDEADVDFFKRNVDADLVAALHYGATNERRRAATNASATCEPDPPAYLAALGLKVSKKVDGGGKLVPLDDESDGVIANNKFYGNPDRKPNYRNALAKASKGKGLCC